MNSKIEALGTSTGKILYSSDCQNILDLSVAETMELFKSSGVILFRGFGVTPKQMKDFSEQFSGRHIIDFTKVSIDSDKFVNFVDGGIDGLIPHCENSCFPFRPDVIWFCCTVPAEQEGETLFWDGVRVWEELSQESKQLFISKQLKFSYNNIPVDRLKIILGYSAHTIDDIKQILDSLDGVSYQFNDDKTVYVEYTCSAVVKNKYTHQNAFANHFWVYQKKTEEAIFEDGSRASDEVADEIETIFDKLTEKIPWEAGDLVMMDNSRFLHGRKAFNDNRRQVFTTLSNLKF
ncbi:MAG: TauD/TfdA family dioxygenase [Brasilonema octagenarum HA4186-MV1]|jgi:alpha-ketoglutarate-dependent taurine dioxygenase|nr:TauD/TfdA family dioxygenase [Brasilonema octagenarum HA4186-MV1]